ncbi:hypothetical protein [Streptomyces sp. NBC_00576]|uniref:hypothetical protein n=1 Tax=Streptomyces sp. NBC_00576 TaxID=2903665 RepID=UPI002E814506|nr:hypothetical protein [Streptomyces sp. NBC_00576]WUB74891.1 hypothetical protein OG734_35260 [Streptomyces sp. NBC_00576]
MSDERSTWTGVVTERLRCCICGGSTDDAPDYVLIELTAPASNASQFFGAHAGHLNDALTEGFDVEVHMM